MKKCLSVSPALVLGLALLVGAGMVSCKKGGGKPKVSMEQGWYRYISAHTSGVVPRRSSIRVLFVNDAGRPDQAAPGIVEISPSVPGRAQ